MSIKIWDLKGNLKDYYSALEKDKTETNPNTVYVLVFLFIFIMLLVSGITLFFMYGGFS